MSISYTWEIDSMDSGSTSGAVFSVNFRVTATTTHHLETWRGVASFTPDTSSSSFVAYNSLTEDTVIEWVKASKAGIKGKLIVTQQVLRLEESITKGVPWS